MVKHGTGNWQTRHEASQARRRAAKLRKQQSQDGKDRTRRVQACLDNLQLSLDPLYVWVSKPPQRTSQDDETCERSSSLAASPCSNDQKRRPRSVSLSDQNTSPTRHSKKGDSRRRS